MWGTGRPPACLKLGTHHAFWVESVRRRGHRHESCLVRNLPSGLLRPSPVELNIQDTAQLQTLLRSLTRPRKNGQSVLRLLLPQAPRPVALVLPDLCVRASIIRLEHFPAGKDEQTTLVRWRLSQEQLFPLSGTKVIFQRLGANGSKANGEIRVLAVAIREAVLEQYENVCAALGLCPVEVDTVSFRLFNMWARSAKWFRRTDPEDLVWVSIFDGGLTVLVFQEHQLVFQRTKVMPPEFVSGKGTGRVDVDWIGHEVAASLASCAEQCPEMRLDRMILASEEAVPGLTQAVGGATDLEVEELGWGHAGRAGWTRPSAGTPVAAVPAVAGLLGRA